MANVSQHIYVPWSAGIQSDWTVAQVRSALDAHEQGQFSASAKLVRSMGRDDRLDSVLDTRLNALLGCKFGLELPEAESDMPRWQSMLSDVDAEWYDIVPEEQLAALLRWRIMLGVGIGELRWERTATRWTPSLEVWDPQFAYWDDTNGSLMLSTQEGTIPIEPGDGKWVVLMDGTAGWMTGKVRSLAIPFLIRRFGWRDWARFSERHGMPIVKAMVPSVADERDKDDFFDDIRALSTETTVELPTNVDGSGSGFDLELLEATDTSWEGFERLITSCNVSYSVALLGQNLTTEVQGGSFAAAKVQDTVRQDYLRADAERMSTELREQVLRWVIEYNYGPEAPVPWPMWETAPPEDMTQKADTMVKVLSSLEMAPTTARQIDVRAVLEAFGVPMLEESAVPKLQPAPAVMPAQMVELASGDVVELQDGFIQGELYADRLIEQGTEDGIKAQKSKVQDIAKAIEQATGYDDLKLRLRKLYGKMEPGKQAKVMEQALVLATLAGMYSGQEGG